MAFQTVWYSTELPKNIIEVISDELGFNFDPEMIESTVYGNTLRKDLRNSKNAWIPSEHWIGGFIWHYIERANRENFLYDITNIDSESIQYTSYSVGQYYGWHTDSDLSIHYKPEEIKESETINPIEYLNKTCESVRKISFVLQLSDPDDYEGGNLQLLASNGKPYFAPRKRGTIILFDSRTQHRVLKVTKGIRKSLVGWVVGPRWR